MAHDPLLLEAFGERLHGLRRLRALTLRALARVVRVDPGTITHWERGRVAPTLVNLRYVARALDTSVAYLVGETDNPEPLKQ